MHRYNIWKITGNGTWMTQYAEGRTPEAAFRDSVSESPVLYHDCEGHTFVVAMQGDRNGRDQVGIFVLHRSPADVPVTAKSVIVDA